MCNLLKIFFLYVRLIGLEPTQRMLPKHRSSYKDYWQRFII